MRTLKRHELTGDLKVSLLNVLSCELLYRIANSTTEKGTPGQNLA